MSNKALIIVDYSFDFIDDNGKLTCGKPGQEIETFIFQDEIYHFHNASPLGKIFPVDYYDNFHPESKLFPNHNIHQTPGRELYGEVGRLYNSIKDQMNVHYLDKTRYDSFYGTPLDSLLRERQINDIEIVGVCTDICILHTAVSAYNLGYNITIPIRGVASFNQDGHQWALSHFKNSLGAKVEE